MLLALQSSCLFCSLSWPSSSQSCSLFSLSFWSCSLICSLSYLPAFPIAYPAHPAANSLHPVAYPYGLAAYAACSTIFLRFLYPILHILQPRLLALPSSCPSCSEFSSPCSSVADPDPNPDPHVFGPPGSGSICQRYGSMDPDPDPASDPDLGPSITKQKK
jgi:hypothetical protein